MNDLVDQAIAATVADLKAQRDAARAEAEGLRRERDDLKALADKAMCSYCGHVGPKTQEAMNDHILECEKRPEVKILDEVLAERARADAAEARLRDALTHLRGCVDIVDKAGLLNLSNVFRLGHTRFWYVKASDTFDRARAALAAPVSSPRPEVLSPSALICRKGGDIKHIHVNDCFGPVTAPRPEQEKQQGEEEKP